jgi:isopenicillin-N epimerase
MRPLVASWSEHRGFPLSFDQAGTLDLTGWLAAPVSLEVLKRLDIDRLRRHNERLADYGQRVFCAELGVEVPDQPSAAPSMRIVPLPPAVTDAAAFGSRIATECRCEIPVTFFADHTFLRLSAHAYNRPADYETAARAIAGLLAG